MSGIIESQRREIDHSLAGDEQLRRDQQLLHEQLSSLPYTSSYVYPMQPCYIGQTAPLTACSCGEQVLDVVLPHYKDVRMQHSQNR